jgi:hypothetical protein
MLRGRETPKAEREKKNMKHQAYNTYTGEIITSTRAKAVQRRVKTLNRFEHRFGLKDIARTYSKSWIFCHDGRFTK